MEGEVFFEDPLFGRAVAPNLTAAVRNTTPEQFEAIVRQGIRKDATGVGIDESRDLGLMARVSERRFSHLTDAEVDDLYDYLVSR
jgi:hypothetical protein